MEKIIFHKHRLIPGHMGGTYEKGNVLLVNVALHAFLHKLLYEEYGKWQDKVAWLALSKQIGFEEATILAGKLANIGRVDSLETRRKKSLARLGKPSPNKNKKASMKTREKHRKRRLGSSHKKETKEKISDSQKNIYLVLCPDGVNIITSDIRSFAKQKNIPVYRFYELAKRTYENFCGYSVEILKLSKRKSKNVQYQ